jgi:hypothetical protein
MTPPLYRKRGTTRRAAGVDASEIPGGFHRAETDVRTKVNLSNSKGPALEFHPSFLLERRIT